MTRGVAGVERTKWSCRSCLDENGEVSEMQRERACPLVGLPPRVEDDEPVAYLGTVGQGKTTTYDPHSGVNRCPQGIYLEEFETLETLWLLNRSTLTRAERGSIPYRTLQALIGSARYLS